MNHEIRFGDLIRQTSINQQVVSYNDLIPKHEFGPDGNEIPYIPTEGFFTRFP